MQMNQNNNTSIKAKIAKSDKLWGGRFHEGKDPVMATFDNSFPIDKRLWQEDIRGSQAHVAMLTKCGILSKEEGELLQNTLDQLAREIQDGSLPLTGDDEDIHSFVEAQVVKRLGTTGKKIHTARSRNDQVATDMKLYARSQVNILLSEIRDFREILRNKAQDCPFPMPGYTHLQRGQIVTFKYHLLAYEQMMRRDERRLESALTIMNSCPLGSGALAGSTYEVDRSFTAEALGFAGYQENTMDAVSDRDYILEFLSHFSIVMMHLSRLAEELILFTTREFGYIRLSDRYSTGSSLMPQKKNPDSLELIRGKTGRIYGNLMGFLTTMKGLPLTYNKDMQEDKTYFFESCDTVRDCLHIMGQVIETMTVDAGKMEKATQGGFLNATELADYLVRKDLPFRQAHQIVGRIVAFCEVRACEIQDLSIAELRQFCDRIDQDVYTAIDPGTILHQGNKKVML